MQPTPTDAHPTTSATEAQPKARKGLKVRTATILGRPITLIAERAYRARAIGTTLVIEVLDPSGAVAHTTRPFSSTEEMLRWAVLFGAEQRSRGGAW